MEFLGKPIMSQEEVKDNFKLERKKHFDFFLPFYREKNWQVLEDNIDSGCKNDWDVKLEVFAGKYITVDEKAVRGEYNKCLVEIIQDIKTANLGWFYGNSERILWGNWRQVENVYPSSLYLIDHKKLADYIVLIKEGFVNTWIDKKGWGNTLNLVIDWKILIDKQIAEKLL